MRNKFTAFLLILMVFSLTFNNYKVDAAEKYSIKINVTDSKYGAKSGTDSTTAIQKALDKAAASATSRKRALVTIPKGTYLISSPLRISSNTYLKCSSNTVIRKSSNKCLYMLRSNPGTLGSYSDTKNITIEGGTFDADFIEYNENSGGSLFFFSHTSGLEIKNVTLTNNLGTHLIELAGAESVTIKNCKLHGFKYGKNNSDKEAIQLDITHSDSIAPDAAPYDDTPCRKITITNNEIFDYPRAIGSHSAVKGIYHSNVKISKNDIHDISGTAVYAYNYIDLEVTNNDFKDIGTGVAVKTFASSAPKTLHDRNSGISAMKINEDNFNIRVTDNKINTITSKDDGDGGSMGIFIYGTKEYPMSGCIISGNELTTLSSGIYLRFISKAEISGNTVERPATANKSSETKSAEDGIKLLTSVSCKIEKNIISAKGQSFENGIAVRDFSTDTIITDNEIHNPEKTGIALYDSSAGIIERNTIDKSGKHGITAVGNCTVSIKSNNISGSGENGITITSSSTADITDGNSISGSGSNGVSVTKNCQLSVKDNKIFDNKGIGILVSTSSLDVISGNGITDNVSKGISLKSVKKGTVTNNFLSNSRAKWEMTLSSTKLSPLYNMYSIQSVEAKAGDYTITGIANKGVRVHAKVNNSEYYTDSTKRNFNISVSSLKSGDQVMVYVTDPAGNKVYRSLIVK